MKRISLLIFCVCLISLFGINSFAVTEYKNQGFYLEIPEWLIYDEEWAKENSYTGYWHSEDYGFEVFVWKGEGVFGLQPADTSLLCYHDKKADEITFSKAFSRSEYINSLLCDFFNAEVYTDGEPLFDCFVYEFEKDGELYNIRFSVHDEEYEYFANEIAQTFRVVKDYSFKESLNSFFVRYFFSDIKHMKLTAAEKAFLIIVLTGVSYFAWKGQRNRRKRG